MSDKEFTDEEIVKAVECCSEPCCVCDECPLYCVGANCSSFELHRYALDLINRQKSEIERLKSANDEKFRQWDMLAEKKKQHYADSYNEAKDILKAGPIGFICRARLAIRSIKQIGSEKE